MRPRLNPLFAIFLTVMIDMLSFGLVIPDIQLRGEALGAKGWEMGLLIAVFSIAQFAFAPFLGRLSDAVGRRKILVVSSLLSAISFVVYAHADTLGLMFFSRALCGVAGANLGVAYAYVADVTEAKDRAKGMGFVGAAFGIGFLLGPATGAFLARFDHLRHLHALGLEPTKANELISFQGQPLVLGYAAAAISFVNFLYVLFFLPESVKKEEGRQELRRSTLQNLALGFKTPTLGLLLAMFVAYGFAFSNLESTYFRLAESRFHLNQIQTALVLTLVGVVSALMQGVVTRIAVQRFGEVKLVRFAYLLQAPVLLCIPFAYPWPPLIVATVLLGIGGGLAQPSLSSLISQSAPPEMQGGVFGVTQALGAMARIAGPLAANYLFDFNAAAPYILAAVLMVLPALGAFRVSEEQFARPAFGSAVS